MKRGGCKFGDGKTRGCPWPKRGGCSFQMGTQTQRVNTPPPPPPHWAIERMQYAIERLYTWCNFDMITLKIWGGDDYVENMGWEI